MRSGAVSLVGAFLGLGLGLAPSARGAALEGLQGPTAQATPTPTPPPPPLVAAGLPIKFGASLTIRNDTIDVADQTDLLLDDQTSALRARFRLWLDYRDPSAVVNAGLRFGSAQNPNPTASFIRLGNAFRTESFGLDQFYLSVRPFKNREAVSLSAGKMPLPFWRGEKGPFRTQLLWDHDISPTGVAGKVAITLRQSEKAGSIRIENAGGYFVMEDVPAARFTGLSGKTFLIADQLHVQAPHLGVAVGYFGFENLNAGLRSPAFEPGAGAFLLPGTFAFLARPGLQVTNSIVNYGPGARGYVEEHFRVVNALAQVDFPIHLKGLGRTQFFLLGDYSRNTSVSREATGYGLTGGLYGGGWGGPKLHPYELHFTWADVDRDATLSVFANGDLGSGTDFKGWEAAANYRFTKNLLLAIFYFHYDGAPLKDSFVRRLFVDLTWDF